MVLPEGLVNLSGFEETLDMPCRIFHADKYGQSGDLGFAGIGSHRLEREEELICGLWLPIVCKNHEDQKKHA
jgi:hypothetical protein